jgi:transcription antitermination factor NusA-like protein
MKTPICDLCAQSGALCSGCRQKLSEGKVSDLDVQVSGLLWKINEKHNISEARFIKAVDLGRVILILTDGDVGILIGREGKVVSELSHALGKKVRIAESSGDVRKTLEDILMPVKLLGINKVYHEGREVQKVRLPRADMHRLPVDIPTLEQVLRSFLNSEVKVSFE